MSNTPYLPAIEDALYSHSVLHLIDVCRDIENIHRMNGPSGRMLGRRVMDYLDAKGSGKTMEDLTVRELSDIIGETRNEYRKLHHPTDRVIHID